MSNEKIPEMKIIREVNIAAEDFYDDAVKLGEHAAYAFQDLNRSRRNSHRAQMTGLENIAESSLKTSDIFDYIKKQTARFDHWRKGLPGGENDQGFGMRLMKYLEDDLVKKRDSIAKRLNINDKSDPDKRERRRIYLLLIRQFIRQMVVHFEYRASEIGQEGVKDAVDNKTA